MYDAKELVEAFTTIRAERERLAREYEAADGALKADQEQLKVALLALCNEVNSDSIKTKAGTAIRKLKERFFCSDWPEFSKFLLEHEELDLMERRIHQGNFKNYLAEHKDEGLPPGVNVTREYVIEVRRPASSSRNYAEEGDTHE